MLRCMSLRRERAFGPLPSNTCSPTIPKPTITKLLGTGRRYKHTTPTGCPLPASPICCFPAPNFHSHPSRVEQKRRSRCRERNTATVAKYCVTIWAQWHYSDTRTKPAVREANCSPRPRKEANRQSSSLPYAGSKNTCRRRGGVVRMSSDKQPGRDTTSVSRLAEAGARHGAAVDQ